jgi:hypothetical protein
LPFTYEPTFTRQGHSETKAVGLVIPATASLSGRLTGTARELAAALGSPTVAPGAFSFHYVDWPADKALLQDDAFVDTGIYVFSVRDAVIGVFDLARWGHDQFCWAFASSAQRDVLAAVRVGQTLDVQFEVPLAEAFHVLTNHFPSGVPNSGYGDYAFHVSIDPPRPDGFRVLSSFEPQSQRTESRLPFFFGFRVFGTAAGAPPTPIWRELLGHAVRQAAHQRWSYCLLYTAISLESFIDGKLADRLSEAAVGEDYIDHILRVGDRRLELSALNARDGRLSNSALRKLGDRLNSDVFTPRNRLAHGKWSESDVGPERAVAALKAAVSFMWDWDKDSRYLLLTPLRTSSFEAMIDDDLLAACQVDPRE